MLSFPFRWVWKNILPFLRHSVVIPSECMKCYFLLLFQSLVDPIILLHQSLRLINCKVSMLVCSSNYLLHGFGNNKSNLVLDLFVHFAWYNHPIDCSSYNFHFRSLSSSCPSSQSGSQCHLAFVDYQAWWKYIPAQCITLLSGQCSIVVSTITQRYCFLCKTYLLSLNSSDEKMIIKKRNGNKEEKRDEQKKRGMDISQLRERERGGEGRGWIDRDGEGSWGDQEKERVRESERGESEGLEREKRAIYTRKFALIYVRWFFKVDRWTQTSPDNGWGNLADLSMRF